MVVNIRWYDTRLPIIPGARVSVIAHPATWAEFETAVTTLVGLPQFLEPARFFETSFGGWVKRSNHSLEYVVFTTFVADQLHLLDDLLTRHGIEKTVF